MTKREFIGKGGEVWTWEETPETVEALKQLHKTWQSIDFIMIFENLKQKHLIMELVNETTHT